MFEGAGIKKLRGHRFGLEEEKARITSEKTHNFESKINASPN